MFPRKVRILFDISGKECSCENAEIVRTETGLDLVDHEECMTVAIDGEIPLEGKVRLYYYSGTKEEEPCYRATGSPDSMGDIDIIFL